MEEIKARLSADLKNAMKEKNNVEIKTIRLLMSALDNAGAIAVETPSVMPSAGGIAGATAGLGSTEAPRKELSEGDIKQIIINEIAEIQHAIEAIGDGEPAAKELKAQEAILQRYYETELKA